MNEVNDNESQQHRNYVSFGGSHWGSLADQIRDNSGLPNNTRRRPGEWNHVNPSSQTEHNDLRDNIRQKSTWRTADEPLRSSAKIANAWEKCHHFMKGRDVAMCNAWREEVEKLLIFAGLFSATVTAFIVESYKWLKPESNDITAQYLGFLTAQFAQAQNITLPETLSRLNALPEVTSSAIRINVFWFLSLVFNLSAVLVGILCCQWLREFQEESPNISHKEAVSLRQIKFNGLQSWHVPAILSALPLLLQAALVLFFAGILDLLWHCNRVVATITTVAVGVIILFLAITTVTPALQYVWYCRPSVILRTSGLVPQCPFKSTQSWLILQFTSWIQSLGRTRRNFVTSNKGIHAQSISDRFFDWMAFDLLWQHRRFKFWRSQGGIASYHAVDWMHDTWSQSADVIDLLDGCMAYLDIDDAEALLRKWYRNRPASTESLDQDLAIFRNTEKHRDIISIHFLSLHMEQHPALRPRWAEIVLNTYSIDSDAYQNSLHEVLKSVSKTEIEYKIESETMITAINSLCIYCNKHPDGVSPLQIFYGWKILRKLIWSDDSLRHSGGTSLQDLNVHYFSFACRVSTTFQTLLRLNMDNPQADACADGLSRLLPRELEEEDILELSKNFPEFANIISFVRFLETSEKEGLWKPHEWVEEIWRGFTSKFVKFKDNNESGVQFVDWQLHRVVGSK